MTTAEAPEAATGPRGRMDKRRAILDAAAEVFAEEGYERASIDAIAARSGVSKPTIYNHFGAKEKLFRESVAQSAETINAESMAVLQSMDVRPKTWRSNIYRIGMALVACQFSPCARSLQQQMYAEINRDPELFTTVRARAADPMIETLAGKFAMLGNAGLLRVADPHVAANQFFALIAAEVPQLSKLGTVEVPAAEIKRAVHAGVDTFLRAYAAD